MTASLLYRDAVMTIYLSFLISLTVFPHLGNIINLKQMLMKNFYFFMCFIYEYSTV